MAFREIADSFVSPPLAFVALDRTVSRFRSRHASLLTSWTLKDDVVGHTGGSQLESISNNNHIAGRLRQVVAVTMTIHLPVTNCSCGDSHLQTTPGIRKAFAENLTMRFAQRSHSPCSALFAGGLQVSLSKRSPTLRLFRVFLWQRHPELNQRCHLDRRRRVSS